MKTSVRRNSGPSAHRMLILLVLGAAFVLGACGSSSPPKKSAPPSASQQIKKDWAAFFAGTTSASNKVSLLQNGTAFSSVIKGQAGSALAKSASATVSKITLTSSSTATVIYTVLLGGQPALRDQTGEAVLEDGKWKVGTASFCALLALEQVSTPACPTPTLSS